MKIEWAKGMSFLTPFKVNGTVFCKEPGAGFWFVFCWFVIRFSRRNTLVTWLPSPGR